MFLCARTRCRNRLQLSDDVVDIKDLPNHYEVQYILKCGHSLCEKCLYMTVQSDQRSYICDQCKVKTTLSARAFNTIKEGNLSNPTVIARLNGGFSEELPIDAYSFGLAFCEGHLIASPVESLTSPDERQPTMEEIFKYSKEGVDEDNIRLKGLIPPARRNKIITIMSAMHNAVSTHAECGVSLKVLGNLERKLTKEFYEAKMSLREKFQVLHSLLQLEELKGLTRFDEIYQRRKEEFCQKEKHFHSVRRQISETFELEHDTLEGLTKKRKLLKELIAKPSRISWRHYEIADEFIFHLDDHLQTVIKDSLVLKNIEKATTLAIEVLHPESSSSREPLPLFRSPPHHVSQIPAPGTSPSLSELPNTAEPLSLNVLKAYTQVHVKLSTVINPNHFFVHLWDDKEKIEKLRDEIEKWCTQTYTSPPSVNSLKPGAFIFVYWEKISRWTRARLLAINIDPSKAYRKKTEFGKPAPSAYGYYSSISVDVQLLDYGGVQRMSYSRIRQPFDELFDTKSWPFFALKCSMYGLDSSDDDWSESSIKLMKKWAGSYELLMRIYQVSGETHLVDLRYHHAPPQVRNSVSLKETLVFCREAILICHLYGHEDSIASAKEIAFTIPERIPINRTETVLITAITNPDLFYVTKYSSQDKFHELHESLKIYFDLPEDPYIVHNLKKGLPCVALDEGTFYRAQIINLIDHEKVQVQFVDFGTTKILEAARLKLIREEFLRQPIHAIPCKLGDIGPIGFTWSDETVSKFQELCFGGPTGNSHLFNLSIIDYDSKGKHIVNLRRYTGTEYLSVNVALVSLKFALSTGPITETPADSTMVTQFDTKLDDRIFKALVDFDVNGYTILKELVTRNREAESSKIDSYIKIRVSHWVNPDEFYIQITSSEVRSYFVCYENKLVDDYHQKLDDPVPPSQHRLELDEPVVFAQVEEFDVIWRRGLIVKREAVENETIECVDSGEGFEIGVVQDKPKTKYTVLARDFGYTIQVPRKYIFRLSKGSTYLKDGDFCLKCNLANIIPAGGGNWTKTALEGFGELLKKYQYDLLLHVVDRYLPKDRPQSIAVDLIAKDCYIPDGIAATQVKFYEFSKMLIKKGLAVPTSKVDISDQDDNPNSEELPFKKTLIPYTNRKGDTVLGYIRNARAAAQRQMDNNVVRFYKEAEKPKEQSFIGLPTEISLDMKIWFRIHPLEGPQLINVVNRTITNALRDQDQFLPFAGDYILGRACTAFFPFDKTWNRAEILYPLDEERVFVRFVDYGNEVPVTKEQLSSQVFNLEIPKLALNGKLADCRSNAQGIEAEKLQQQIHQLIIDHKCVFKWMNFKSLKEMRFTIIMPDGVSLSRYLIANNANVEADETDDQTLVSIPPMVRDILQRLPVVGFKPSTLKFEPNVYYPVVITGPFRETYTFIQPKPIAYPSNEIEVEIELRYKEFLKFLSEMRAEVNRFEAVKELKAGDIVAAQFSDCQWYRGMIVENAVTIFGDQYRVFYVDYGNTSVVESSKLRKLPMKYVQSPELFAIPARVCNVKPGKSGSWSTYLLDLMDREVTSNELNTIALIKSRTDPWDIEVYIADPKDPKTPLSSLWEPLYKDNQLIEVPFNADD